MSLLVRPEEIVFQRQCGSHSEAPSLCRLACLQELWSLRISLNVIGSDGHPATHQTAFYVCVLLWHETGVPTAPGELTVDPAQDRGNEE